MPNPDRGLPPSRTDQFPVLFIHEIRLLCPFFSCLLFSFFFFSFGYLCWHRLGHTSCWQRAQFVSTPFEGSASKSKTRLVKLYSVSSHTPFCIPRTHSFRPSLSGITYTPSLHHRPHFPQYSFRFILNWFSFTIYTFWLTGKQPCPAIPPCQLCTDMSMAYSVKPSCLLCLWVFLFNGHSRWLQYLPCLMWIRPACLVFCSVHESVHNWLCLAVGCSKVFAAGSDLLLTKVNIAGCT